MGGLTVLSNIIGWLYFFFWGISFYGQIYENWKCKRYRSIHPHHPYLALKGWRSTSWL